MRFVVGFDGSDCAKRALQRAAALAREGDELVVVAVIPEASTPSTMVTQQRLLEDAGFDLAGSNVRLSTVEAKGEPAEAVAKAAKEARADIIVVGSRGRGAVAGLVLGSVSSKLVREAPCDVLVVR